MKIDILYQDIEKMIIESTKEYHAPPVDVIAYEFLGFKNLGECVCNSQKEEVEKELGFSLYPWQVNYIWGDIGLQFPIKNGSMIRIRGAGKTTAQIVSQLLDERKEYDFRRGLIGVAFGNSIQEMKSYKGMAKDIYEKLKRNQNLRLAKCIF